MNACGDKLLLLNALVDGELDAANAVVIERHLQTCSGCAAKLAELKAVREVIGADAMRYLAPDPFRRRLRIALDQQARPVARPGPRAFAWRRWWTWAPFGGLAAGGVAALLFAGVYTVQRPLTDELVSDHVRSLLAAHLMDVPTSDRHVVKPWFDGKVSFAPTVIDFKDKGFPLLGGRLDVVRNQRAAALVYRRRLHVINVFVWPETSGDRFASDHTLNGYHLLHWSSGGLSYWAVSDLDFTELGEFRTLYLSALKP